MSVQEIETAITQLPSPELSRLAAWFEEYQADLWDRQIEADALAGKLDTLGAEADREFGSRPLPSPVTHFTTPQFWQLYNALPPEVRALADKNFALLQSDPSHSSLRFKKVGGYWSARVGLHYRVLAKERTEGLVWFWIGPHTVYDSLLRQA